MQEEELGENTLKSSTLTLLLHLCVFSWFATEMVGFLFIFYLHEMIFHFVEKRNRPGCPSIDVGKRLCGYRPTEGKETLY